MTEDWIEKLLRDYQDAVTRGAYEGICRLGEPGRETVMVHQARACADAFVKLYDLPPDLGLDGFIERMRTGGPSPITIQRDGDTILWEEHHEGVCMCPLVRRDVVPLSSTLCTCAVHWLRVLIERFAGRPARVELLGSVAGGNASCTFRVTLAGPASARHQPRAASR